MFCPVAQTAHANERKSTFFNAILFFSSSRVDIMAHKLLETPNP
jgi:hypothetical protein